MKSKLIVACICWTQLASAADIVPPRARSEQAALRPAGAEGEADVVVELWVTATGSVKEALVVSGPEPFAEAARKAALLFSFEPATRAGTPIAARIRVQLHFGLEPPTSRDPLTGAAAADPGTAAAADSAPTDPKPEREPSHSSSPEASAALTQVTVVGIRKPLARGFSRAEVRQLPGALGDPFRAIEALPGVTPTLSGAPYFYVRGAPPGDLGYYFDGIALPALFHALAGPSVVHPGLVDSVTLYPGPYPIEFGTYAGGIVAGTRTPPAAVPRGELSLRVIDSSALFETPLANGDLDLSVSGRYAYANPIVHIFSDRVSVDYWDYQARLGARLSSRDRLSVQAFGAHDLLVDHQRDEAETIYGITFHRIEMRYERRLDQGTLTLSTLTGWDQSAIDDGRVEVKELSSETKVELRQRLSNQVALTTGAQLRQGQSDLSADGVDEPARRARFLRNFPEGVHAVTSAFFGLYLDAGGGLRVMPGLRADFHAAGGEHALGIDPRLSSELDVSPTVTLLNGVGIARQAPSTALPRPGLEPALRGGLQTALQSSAGIRLRLPQALALELTLFQNALFNLTDSLGQSRLDNGDRDINRRTRATGRARGVEFLLKRSLSQRLGGYLAYTLASSERSLSRVRGPALFDRRHVLSAALAYDFGGGFKSGLRGMLYTGIPADVAYVKAAEDPPRTPPFYRLDLRGEKRFALGDAAHVSLVLEVVNTTLHRETLRKSCNAFTCREDTVGPITIPSLALEAGF